MLDFFGPTFLVPSRPDRKKMLLIIVRTQSEMIVGEAAVRFDSSIMNASLENPMLVIQQQITQPPKIAGGQPQILTGFRLVPIPCRKIFLSDISYWGEVEPTDPLCETYAKVLNAINENKKSPLLVSQ